MSKAKTPRSKSQPRKKAPPVEPYKGSVTYLTQDPKVKGGVIVPRDDPFILTSPGTVVICGPLILPGQDLEIKAAMLATQTDTKGQAALIDASAPDWNGTPLPPLPPKDFNAKENFGQIVAANGETGATGEAGKNAGNVTVHAETYQLTTPLTIRAEGGSGGTAQAGQDGGPGIPFMGPASIGGQGGDGGVGGAGGRGGIITINYRNLPAPSIATSVKGGKGGKGGKAGNGGPGADHTGAGTGLGPPGRHGNPGNEGDEGVTGPEGQVIIKSVAEVP